MNRHILTSLICIILSVLVGCASVNPNMPREIRYVQEDNCSDALAQALAIANSGDPGGQYSMGVLWARGCGVPRHHRNAYDWFMLAANGGDVRAILKIGDMHYHGEAVEQDADRATEWYSLAARMDSEVARAKLTNMRRPIPPVDLPAAVTAPARPSWISEFAQVFLIGAAAYYGARTTALSSTNRATDSSTYRTNCFISSFGNGVNLNCNTR